MAALLHCREAQRQRRGHGFQPGRFSRPGQQRPGRKVREHRESRGDLHQSPFQWRNPSRTGSSETGPGARDPQRGRSIDTRGVRGTRIQQGNSPRDAGRRSRESVLRRRQALGTGEKG